MRCSALACRVSICKVAIARLMSVARLVGVRLCTVEGLSKLGGAGNGEGRIDGPGVYGGEGECGSGVLKETGQSGLGARQFGESERFGAGLGEPACGSGSLRYSEWLGLGLRDPREVLLSPRSAGGT